MAVPLELGTRVRTARVSPQAVERLVLGAAVVGFVLMGWLLVHFHSPVMMDDTYITYQSARNFAEGHGLVFNLGERYLSTSAPLYALLLGILGLPNVQAIPAISDVISFVSLVAMASALLAYGRRIGNVWFGWVSGTLLLAMPPVSYSIGFEVLPQTAMVLWGFYFLLVCRESRRPAYASSVLLALAVLMRPDGLLAAGAAVLVIGASVVKNACTDAECAVPEEDEADRPKAIIEMKAFWEGILTRLDLETRTLSWKVIGVFVAIISVAASASYLYYGSPLPGTMAAKSAQVDSGAWASFVQGANQWFVQKFPRDYPTIVAIYLMAGAGCLVIVSKPRFALLLAWPLLHALAFKVGRLPFYAWYYVPECVGICVLAGLGLSEIIQRMNVMIVGKWAAAALSLTMIYQVASGQLRGIASDARAYPQNNPQGRLYPLAAEWLVQNTQPTDRIGYYEIGLLAWCSQRRFVDPLGLCTPGQADNVRRKAFDAGYRENEPEYILKYQRSAEVMNKDTKKLVTKWGSVYGLDPDKKAWFRACYEHEADVRVDNYRIAIFRKVQSYSKWRQSRYKK